MSECLYDSFFLNNVHITSTMKKVILSIIIACLFNCCIQEFIPQGIEEVRGILVIDGMIQDGESVFRISYSVGISDTLDGSEAINHAEVYVESDDGMRIPAFFAGNGTYVAQTPVLEAAKAYRLSVLIDGEICESEYLSPIFTTEIDSIFPIKEGGNSSVEPIKICIATFDPDNRSVYYRWKYRETWEVKAELYAQGRYLEDENGRIIDYGTIIPHSLRTSENTYYCWGRDSSKTFVLASTEKLLENRIAQQQLVTIPSDHDKLSVLYHIEVEQMQIRETAYNYFADIKEQTDRSGDIFDPIITTGLRGNISFRNDPERVVIGYIEVATITTVDRYIWEREGFYNPPLRMCTPYVIPWEGTYMLWDRDFFGYVRAVYNDEASADKRCVDCRTKENASKAKPLGWPTDHL